MNKLIFHVTTNYVPNVLTLKPKKNWQKLNHFCMSNVRPFGQILDSVANEIFKYFAEI